ncbi:penicillin-binding protein 2 [Aquisalimonas lutea]|uniref:penicillin-binding protein 2 n=1 Tax=Aquisalimonas lutea TaxID=1327750 RepID=UPI0025B58166|nr:penicillin-binding protein 2 [Aquisalimonas lutea]MDN3516034.1 penicillin-binding protein 2 [Aquisalimonas lutea]
MANGRNSDDNQLRDRTGEKRQFTRRTFVAGTGVLALMGLLGGRMGQLQVAGHQRYSTLSQANRVKLVPIPPNRGLIYDRNGIVLAENRPNFQLLVTPEQIPDMEATLSGLRQILDISDAEVERFRDLVARSRSFEALPLKVRLTDREVAVFATNRHRFPGVEVEARLSRHYPHGSHAAHAIGYVGRINEQELQRLDSRGYGGSSHIGKTGSELQFEERLHGESGLERVETNALGRVIQPLGRRAPEPGDDVVMTLDSRLQRVAEDALGDQSGSVVAIDVRNGDILALASTPSFDPNLFVNGIDRATYAGLQENPERPLFNRAVRGQYPPGSTIKPFLGLAGLEHGTVDPDDTYYCPGYFTIDNVNHRWRCWRRVGHGDMDFASAMAQSCDVYYYNLGYELGIDAMAAFLGRFGFGRKPGTGIPGERDGILPSREWKRNARGESWYHGETIITAIGQGYFLATPLQLAHATSVIANRGLSFPPRILRAVREAATGKTVEAAAPEPERVVELDNPEHWDYLVAALERVIHGERGTGRSVGSDLGYRMAGKTGTSQVFSLGQEEDYDEEKLRRGLLDHALFTAFAPANDPRIAVTAVVEHGGSGGGVAAPVARKVMDAYLNPADGGGDRV